MVFFCCQSFEKVIFVCLKNVTQISFHAAILEILVEKETIFSFMFDALINI